MKVEEWRDIEGYIGLYQVSSWGRVKSLERTVWDNRGYYKTISERILKGGKTMDGYLQASLCKEGKKKLYLVHRLVCEAFCENPHGYLEVNHINENKADNRACNLEWVSHKENLNHGTRNERASEKLRGKKQTEEHVRKRSRAVTATNKVTGQTIIFPSVREASRQTGIDLGSICSCCQGKRHSAGNYIWHYLEDQKED